MDDLRRILILRGLVFCFILYMIAFICMQPRVWEGFDIKKVKNIKEFQDTVELLLLLQNPEILQRKGLPPYKFKKFIPQPFKKKYTNIFNLPPVKDDPEDVFNDEKEEKEEKEPTEKEAEEIIKKLGGYCQLDSKFEEYFLSLAKKVESVLDDEHKKKKYTYVVINSDILNAFITPAGGQNSYRVHVFKGLIEAMTSEAELLGVIGHEIGHSTSCPANLCPSQTAADRMAVKYLMRLNIDPYAIAYALNRIKLSKLLKKTKFPKEVPKRWREASTKIDERIKKIDEYIKNESKSPTKGEYLIPEYASFKIECKKQQ